MSTVLESEPYINNCTDVFLGKMKKFAERKQAIDIGEWCQWCVFLSAALSYIITNLKLSDKGTPSMLLGNYSSANSSVS
jgi:hypothetical protein